MTDPISEPIFFSFTAYQAYKRLCHPADEETEDASLEAGEGESKKAHAVENSAFECDDKVHSSEKGREVSGITQLWEDRPAS